MCRRSAVPTPVPQGAGLAHLLPAIVLQPAGDLVRPSPKPDQVSIQAAMCPPGANTHKLKERNSRRNSPIDQGSDPPVRLYGERLVSGPFGSISKWCSPAVGMDAVTRSNDKLGGWAGCARGREGYGRASAARGERTAAV